MPSVARMAWLASLACAAVALGGCAIDLRPERLEREGPSAATAREGRAVLARMVEAHGGAAAWRAHETISVEYTDTWHSAVRRALAMPWPMNGQRMRLDIRLADHAARITFLDGPEQGLVWGLVGERGWVRAPDGAVEDDDGVRFWVRAFAYFVELPFRLSEAEIVSAEGERTIAGRRYHQVFATWRAPEPQDDIDHWLVYVDAETHLLGWVAYTLRELALVPKGSMRFTEHASTGGVMLPRALASFRDPDSDAQNHSIAVYGLAFDRPLPVGYFERGGAADEPPAKAGVLGDAIAAE
ncbi:MAG: hypothetical protein R3F65_09515 [bacterium]